MEKEDRDNMSEKTIEAQIMDSLRDVLAQDIEAEREGREAKERLLSIERKRREYERAAKGYIKAVFALRDAPDPTDSELHSAHVTARTNVRQGKPPMDLEV